MHRCPFLDRRFNRCLKADLASIPCCTKIPWRRFFRQPSDAPMLMRRFFRCYRPKSFQGAALRPARGGPLGLATPIFSFSLSSLEPKSLRMIILTIILVQVLCVSSIGKTILLNIWHERPFSLRYSPPLPTQKKQRLLV